MYLTGTIILILLLLFIITFVFIWSWFFRNEQLFCEKLYVLGGDALNAKNYKRARHYFYKIITTISDYKDTAFKISICYIELQKYEDAEIYLKQVVKADPKDFIAIYMLAQTLVKQNKAEEAQAAYKDGLKVDPQSLECNKELGILIYSQKDFKNALAYLTTAKDLLNRQEPEKELRQKNEITYYILRCEDELCDDENIEQRVDIINKYIEIGNFGDVPREFDFVVAKAYSKIEKLEEVEKYCNRALKFNPENIEGYKLLSVLQLVKKDYTAAKSTLTEALVLQPKNNELHEIMSYIVCHKVENCNISRCRKKYFELVNKDSK